MERARLKFGCSLRAIEGLWSKRRSISDDEEMVEVTMDDALGYLARGNE